MFNGQQQQSTGSLTKHLSCKTDKLKSIIHECSLSYTWRYGQAGVLETEEYMLNSTVYNAWHNVIALLVYTMFRSREISPSLLTDGKLL